MSIKIAVITDLHYSSIPNPFIPERCGEFADTLLLREIQRFNRYIKPDIVLIGGDLINDSTTQDAESLTKNLYDIIKLLKMPFIAIPGNHDLKNQDFYNIFPRPERFTDIGNTRFVAFDDPEMPGYNAIRQADDIETMRAARADWNGPIVALQHVPLVPPDACRYNYENAPELLKVMADCHYTASISGHLHGGLPTLEHHGVALITAQATCEAPFPYQIIEIADNGIITNKTETLALDSTLNLTDSHVHTSLAYCNENMSIPKINRLAELFGLKQTVITEHSAHLYFDRPSYSAKDFYLRALKPKLYLRGFRIIFQCIKSLQEQTIFWAWRLILTVMENQLLKNNIGQNSNSVMVQFITWPQFPQMTLLNLKLTPSFYLWLSQP
ncbi:MAG: metallophosphoesterase [Bacteroidales bacterium]|nr:metallophosphoesterase [Bacteroidales bacterium]